MNIESILAFTAIVFVIAVIPGPNALLVLFTALSDKKSMAIANIAGVALGFIFHAFISALGLSLIIAQSALAFTLLKWLGVLYLLWLGYTHIKSARNLTALSLPEKRNQSSFKDSFLKGLLTNMLNPKIVLFYLSIFPQFVRQDSAISDSLILGVTQALVVSTWFCMIIIMAQAIRALLTNVKYAKILHYVSGSVFVAFGAKLASSKI